MITGALLKEDVVNMFLDLRNKFDKKFEGYTGDVLISDFRADIDDVLKELSND